MKRRTSQGGSVASFVVIGVILVVGLISAIYFVNQRGQQARKEQGISATSTKQPTKPTTATITTTTKTSVSTPAKQTTQTQTQKSGLPATGIETPIASIVSIFLLSASVVAYVMSRRVIEHSL